MSSWAPPRNTVDVDVIADTNRLDRILAAAPGVGLLAIPEEVAALAAADMTRLRLPDHPSGPIRLDIIASSHPYHARVVARSTVAQLAASPSELRARRT